MQPHTNQCCIYSITTLSPRCNQTVTIVLQESQDLPQGSAHRVPFVKVSYSVKWIPRSGYINAAKTVNMEGRCNKSVFPSLFSENTVNDRGAIPSVLAERPHINDIPRCVSQCTDRLERSPCLFSAKPRVSFTSHSGNSERLHPSPMTGDGRNNGAGIKGMEMRCVRVHVCLCVVWI